MDKKELWRRTFKHVMNDILDLLKVVLIGILIMASFLGFIPLMYFLINIYPIQTTVGITIIGIILFIIFKIQDAYRWEKLIMEREIEDKKKDVENMVSYIVEDIYDTSDR